MTFIYDIVNLELVLIIVFLIMRYFKLDSIRSFLILFHLLMIFLINDVIFDTIYWPDQLRYLRLSQLARWTILGFSDVSHGGLIRGYGPTNYYPSMVFAVFPIPFINSVQSIAMINFLIYLACFSWFKRKNLSTKSVDYFFLLYPSLLLYSSLAVRDNLILLIMMMVVYLILVKEKYMLAFIVSLPLTIIKFQNLLILILTFICYMFLKKLSVKRNLAFLFIGIVIVFFGDKVPVIDGLIDKMNYYRYHLIAESYGYDYSVFKADVGSDEGIYYYQAFEPGWGMVYLSLKGVLYMLFKPFPWEAINAVQAIQSMENIVIIILIVWLNCKKIISPTIRGKILFLNLLLVISMLVNGVVVYNFGTAARYRYVFIVIYFVYYFLFLRYEKDLRHFRFKFNLA